MVGPGWGESAARRLCPSETKLRTPLPIAFVPEPPSPTNTQDTHRQHEHGSRGARQPVSPGKTWASRGTLWTEGPRELGKSTGQSWARVTVGGREPWRRWKYTGQAQTSVRLCGTEYSRTQAQRRGHCYGIRMRTGSWWGGMRTEVWAEEFREGKAGSRNPEGTRRHCRRWVGVAC